MYEPRRRTPIHYTLYSHQGLTVPTHRTKPGVPSMTTWLLTVQAGRM